MSSAKEPVAVIGAGLMGSGIAQVFATGGWPVALQDVSAEALERAVEGIHRNLAFLVERGLGNEEAVESALARISITTDLQEAAGGAAFVVECVFEDMSLKQEVFRTLDACCPPETVLATNTSVMSITAIASRAERRERIVGTHFWNPPYLIPLVEVVRAAETTPETMDRTVAILRAAGKHPVRVEKDVPGFVANRLQHALWREAISIVERGIADAATVDECIRYGFGLRLPVLAPMENADMVGLDLTLSIHDYILPHLEASPEPSPLLRQKVETGDLGFKTGRGFQEWTAEQAQASRDRLLAYLVGVIAGKEGENDRAG
ncbi:MAG: 3-hydroxyacyl-CoA dehydrogenase NAD-binding domain-containing protein [Thermoleophilia bacterium]|nr:3-hydroxyacyl-CoA dehydrogenase NAD-binding domain-containing protein [Thermoleophilia bacterium]